MFPTTLALIALAFALVAIVIAVYATRYARNCYDFVRISNKQSKALAEIAELSSELTVQRDAMAQISKGLRTIRNRMNVRETNAKRKIEREDEDDEAWKRRTTASLQSGAAQRTEK